MRTFSPIQRKSAAAIGALIVALLAASSLLGVLIEKTPLTRLDRRAEAYLENTIARAAATYAIVRGLNGMISVIQGTEIAVSPAGLGLNLSVGEVLDPVNDLVERFSWLMLVSTSSLGLQRILMEMGDWLGLQILLTTALVLLAIAMGKRFWGNIDLRSIGLRLLLLSVMVRLFIPAVALFSETIYDRFLMLHYQTATQAITTLSEELEQMDPTAPEPPQTPGAENRLQDWRRWMSEARDLLDVRAKIDLIGTKVERFTEDTIHLIVIFVLQTIVIPLATLWVILKIAMYRGPTAFHHWHPMMKE